MKVRFANRGGKLYCKVIDGRPLRGGYNAWFSLQVENILKDNGAKRSYLTSTGGGHYTYRFWYQPEEI